MNTLLANLHEDRLEDLDLTFFRDAAGLSAIIS